MVFALCSSVLFLLFISICAELTFYVVATLSRFGVLLVTGDFNGCGLVICLLDYLLAYMPE